MKIGFNPDFAPFSYLKDGVASGIVIDHIREIFNIAGLSPEFIASELSGLTEGLLSGRFDLLAALAKTNERSVKLSFSKPIIVSGAAWFIPKDRQPLSGNNLPGTIVTPKVGPLVSQITLLYPQIKIVTSKDYESSLQDVLYNAAIIDAAALNWHVGRMLIDEKYNGLFHMPTIPFYKIPLSIAARAEDQETIINPLNQNIPDEWGIGDFFE
ncbi:MAG: transporter substrate-binding domain-containing protein [Kordiimonadaceae bacterium]|nr:transporter substrate-binding domain-containing protein [Kordiimonadaceae bacterium]